MDIQNTPSLQDIHHELRARLLADVLRLTCIFGETSACALVGKKIDKPLGLVTPDLECLLRRASWQPTIDEIDLNALPVGKTVDAMYDYAFNARHPVGMTPGVFSMEIEAVEDFVLSFSSDMFDLFFADDLHSRGAPSGALRTLCEHTRARLNLDTGQFVSINDVALLAQLNERSVRNMVAAGDNQQRLRASDDLVENSEARRWLRSKRGFRPTVFQEISEVPGEHPDAITNFLDLGRYLDARWSGLGKSLEAVASELDWTGERADYLRALPAQAQLLDVRDCEALAKTLLVSPAWFTAQVMRLKYPREVELLLQVNSEPPSPPTPGAVDPEVGDPDLLSTRLIFVLHDGTRLYPTRMKNRETKKVAFRLSLGGTGGNTKEAAEEVEDESQMIELVVGQGYAVRMASERGGAKSLYKMSGRVVREAYLDGKLIRGQA
jgi:hypothetical protein